MDQQTQRELAAEFIGTFMLVLVGAGSVVVSPPGIGALGPALAHGLILIAIIGTYGHFSGAYVNPAVTLGVWLGGHLKAQKAGFYVIAQFLGGIVAAVVLLIILPEPGTLGQTTAAADVNELDIILVEGLLTFFLTSVIYQAAVYGKGGSATPVLIGMTLAGCFLLGAPLTGASLNPARTLGPALLADDMQDLGEVLIYLLAIFGGGALAGLVHMDTFKVHDTD
ncbi:MAG TPA: aquaporin, partial [Aggregatilineales bacterium]|nr:aquaporin [Aggregatilineales bacterium]